VSALLYIFLMQFGGGFGRKSFFRCERIVPDLAARDGAGGHVCGVGIWSGAVELLCAVLTATGLRLWLGY